MGILRLLLALVVVCGHAGYMPPRLIGPDLAVETFFMISGFYMAMVLNEKYMADGRVTFAAYKLFFRARLLRLFPLYLVVLLLTVASQCVLLGHGPIQGMIEQSVVARWVHTSAQIAPADKAALLLTNLAMFGQDVVMFLGLDLSTGHLYFTPHFQGAPVAAWTYLLVPQAWSLGVELWFYLLAPFLVTRSVRAIALWALASLVLRIVVLRGFNLYDDPWTYRFFPTELWIFLTGALGYRFYRWTRGREIPAALGYAALALSVVSILLVGRGEGQSRVLFHVGVMAVCIPLVFRLTKNFRVDRYIGELSYPLYLVHILILQVLLSVSFTRLWPLVAACVAGAVVLLHTVDLPVERFRQRWVNRRRPAQAPLTA